MKMNKLLGQATLLLGALMVSTLVLAQPFKNGERLTIGITLHPYYSFVANIVGDKADIVPLIGARYNPHNYNPLPDDMKRAQSLDVLVVNGIGHDQWAFEIMEASGGSKVPYIYANDAVSLIPVAGAADTSVNAHTFISTITAIQQVYEIAKQLGTYDKANAEQYLLNARDYATRLRRLKAEYSAQISHLDTSNFRAATMHGAYGYLMQEFGLQITAVIEPRHGVEPTARQLAQTIDEIKAAGVNVLFAEKFFAGKLADTIQKETGVKMFSFSHISDGEFAPELFETEMRYNLESLKAAIESTKP
jgi:zinc transport system substrate-binding protein